MLSVKFNFRCLCISDVSTFFLKQYSRLLRQLQIGLRDIIICTLPIYTLLALQIDLCFNNACRLDSVHYNSSSHYRSSIVDLDSLLIELPRPIGLLCLDASDVGRSFIDLLHRVVLINASISQRHKVRSGNLARLRFRLFLLPDLC